MVVTVRWISGYRPRENQRSIVSESSGANAAVSASTTVAALAASRTRRFSEAGRRVTSVTSLYDSRAASRARPHSSMMSRYRAKRCGSISSGCAPVGYCFAIPSMMGSLFIRMSGWEPSAAAAFCFFAKSLKTCSNVASDCAGRHLRAAQKHHRIRPPLVLHRDEHANRAWGVAGRQHQRDGGIAERYLLAVRCVHVALHGRAIRPRALEAAVPVRPPMRRAVCRCSAGTRRRPCGRCGRARRSGI